MGNLITIPDKGYISGWKKDLNMYWQLIQTYEGNWIVFIQKNRDKLAVEHDSLLFDDGWMELKLNKRTFPTLYKYKTKVSNKEFNKTLDDIKKYVVENIRKVIEV